MSPEKAYAAAVVELLRQAGVKGAEMRQSLTEERGVVELVTPDGVFASTTVRMRAAPVIDPQQLALPTMGTVPSKPAPVAEVLSDAPVHAEEEPPPRYFLVSYPAGDFDGHHDRYQVTADELGMATITDARSRFVGWVLWHTEGGDERRAVTVVREDALAELQRLADEIRLPLAIEPDLVEEARPRRGDAVLRVGSVVHHEGAAWEVTALTNLVTMRRREGEGVTSVTLFDVHARSDASGEFEVRRMVTERVSLPVVPGATMKPRKKGAPGSKGNPHRGAPIPEADALAQQGALVAVALQPDGHWKPWASNPEKPGGALMTSPEWKKRWGGARRADLRVRLYNRARRCSHDSLDGDHEEGGS